MITKSATRTDATNAGHFRRAAAMLCALPMLIATFLSGCGGGGGNGSSSPMNPPPGSYNLQSAMAALVKGGLSSNVNLSGTVTVNGNSVPFTGSGSLTLEPGVTGQFDGKTALIQTQAITGTVTSAGQTTPYTASVMDAYDSATIAYLGETQTDEYDVAQSPITYPITVSTTTDVLGTLSRYRDTTMSVPLGTIEVSVAVTMVPVDPGSPEVVQVTYKIFDAQQALIGTETFSYLLSENSVLQFNSASAKNASGTLSVTAQ